MGGGTAHSLEAMQEAHLVVKSPGIPSDVPLIKALKAQGKTICSEIEFAAQHTAATLIGITGTNGKTTTTTLLTYQILKGCWAYMWVLAGNIGNSFALQVAQTDFDFYVLELSSFQLDDILDFCTPYSCYHEHHSRPLGSVQLPI